MKETLHKHFFCPIWKCNEVEKQLGKLESEGWKLHKLSGIRNFTFVKCTSKETTYFFTYSFVKEAGMITTDQLLKKQHKANRIAGHFIEGLKTTSVYRMMESPDLSQRRIY